MTKKLYLVLAALWASMAVTACGSNPTTKDNSGAADGDVVNISQRFDGERITVLTREEPYSSEPLLRRGPDFASLTGAKVNVVTVPYSDLYQEIIKDFYAGKNKYDVVVFASQWMVDYVQKGYLEDLTARVAADKGIQWDDVVPFFREFNATYNRKIYTIPLDGDFHMVYYRQDLLQQAGMKPPQTWQDYLAIAKHFHGRDLNGDKKPDYGSCITKKRNAQAHWMVWSVVSAFLQTQGTQQGAFFDPETMKPLVKNEAFALALDIYKETNKYGPENELEMDLFDAQAVFRAGRCALALSWGDIGTQVIDPTTSKVVDKIGVTILPGTRQVLDRATGKLVPCNKITCPYAIEGVNHAPYGAFGGWVGAINTAAPSRTKDASYAFLSYMSQPAQSNIDVTIGITGFNPYRISQFKTREPWLAAGMSFNTASEYLGAINLSLTSPNMVLDMLIPQNNRYQQIVLDSAVADFLADKITRDEAIDRIYNGWEEITTEMGRDRQRAAYRATLGLTAP
ncbi:MAG: ABC transporter substrate-binding protein [Hormoscilla sp.]